jgi:hypothetical protein
MISIVLNVLGLVVIIVATILVYKTGRDNGRNGVLWAILVVVLGITLQWIIPTIATVVMVLVYMSSVTTMPQGMIMEEVDTYAWLIMIGGLVLSFVSIWVVLKIVSRIPEEGPGSAAPPPPPPTFGGPA